MRKLLLALLLLRAPVWGQYDMHETVEGSGSGCAAVEIWSDLSTISTDSSLTGSCNVLNPSGTFLFSAATASACAKFQFRKDENTTANSNFFQFNSNTSIRFRVNLSTSGNIVMLNPGGTNVTCQSSAANNTTYLIEACFEKGTGTNAKVKCRANGETFSETTNGTTDLDMDRLILNDPPTSNERLDEIKLCYGTYNGISDCDAPPATIMADAAVVEGFYLPVFEIQAQNLPGGEEEEAYAGATLTALSGKSPHTWAVSSGALPTGLSLSSGGEISGTPGTGTEGTHNFAARATDADGGLAYRAFSMTVQTLPDDFQEAWERDFTAVRTHYVSTTGTGNGDISTPEGIDTAIGHYVAGDHHVLRAGKYAGQKDFTRSCTEANPCRFGCFIDANGDPEQCEIAGSSSASGVNDAWRLTGTWVWIWPMYSIHPDTEAGSRATIQMQGAGQAVINSLFQRRRQEHCVDSFAFGANMVIYGLTAIDCGWNQANTPARHDIYTQNRPETHGRKYIVQATLLDTIALPPSKNNRAVININASGSSESTESRTSMYTIRDSTLQNGRIFQTTHTGYAGGPPSDRNVLRNLWVDSMGGTNGWDMGSHGLHAIDIEDTLIRSSKMRWRMLGAQDTCRAYNHISNFQNNRILNPTGGVYIDLMTRRTVAGDPACTMNSSVKIRDQDVWDNNTYGRTTGTGTFNLNANGSALTGRTLGQWRVDTDNARETPASAVGFDINSTEGGVPSTDEVECFSNFYNPNWGKCRAINWDGNTTVVLPAAEVSKIISNGKTYKVRNERNFFGTPLTSGTWTTGTNITVTMPSDAVNGVLLVWITSAP
jgi:hypothetical protein